MVVTSALLAFAFSTPAEAADYLPGETILEAVAIEISESGFDAMGGLASFLIPGQMEIGAIEQSEDCWLCSCYVLRFDSAWVDAQIIDTQLIPGNGVIDLQIELDVKVNDSSDPFNLYTEVCNIGDTCHGYVEPVTVLAETTIALQIVQDADGNPVIDAIVAPLDVQHSLASDDIILNDCIIGDVEYVLDLVGLSMYDLVLGQLDSQIEDMLDDATGSIEEALEDAFSSAVISQEIAVGESSVDLDLYPDDISITPEGMTLVMAGAADGAQHICVERFDTGGSLRTDSNMPSVTRAPGALSVLLSDDFSNQMFYGLWRSGLLCYEIEDSSGLPMTTAILSLLTGDAFDHLFPEAAPIVISTSPRNPPMINYEGDSDINVEIEDLVLDIFAEVDGRISRLLGVGLNTEVGVNLNFDDTTGAFAAEVVLDLDNLDMSMAYNELTPEKNDEIIAQFSSSLGGVIEPLIGGMLGDIFSMNIGSMEGVGITSLTLAPAGANGDWLEIAADLGAVPYAGGCDCSGEGEDGSDCESGCSSSHGKSRAMLLLPLAVAVLFRRRR